MYLFISITDKKKIMGKSSFIKDKLLYIYKKIIGNTSSFHNFVAIILPKCKCHAIYNCQLIKTCIAWWRNTSSWYSLIYSITTNKTQQCNFCTLNISEVVWSCFYAIFFIVDVSSIYMMSSKKFVPVCCAKFVLIKQFVIKCCWIHKITTVLYTLPHLQQYFLYYLF